MPGAFNVASITELTGSNLSTPIAVVHIEVCCSATLQIQGNRDSSGERVSASCGTAGTAGVLASRSSLDRSMREHLQHNLHITNPRCSKLSISYASYKLTRQQAYHSSKSQLAERESNLRLCLRSFQHPHPKPRFRALELRRFVCRVTRLGCGV